MPRDWSQSQGELDQPTARIDQRIAAAAEDGVLTTAELVGCGLSRQAVAWRAKVGRLHRLYRGVYAVGHAEVSEIGRLRAAVKAVGEPVHVSHRAAADLWGFWELSTGPIDVTVPGPRRPRIPGIRAHRARLGGGDMTTHNGLPVTTPARTLVDLAGQLTETELRKATRRAIGMRMTSTDLILVAAGRSRGRRGTTKLARVLADGVPTRSELEDVVLSIIMDADLPRPEVNRPLVIAGRTVIPDFRWPAQRVVLEADGASWHDHPVARGEDRARQRLLEAHGETVLRTTWREAMRAPAAVRRRVEAALHASSGQ